MTPNEKSEQIINRFKQKGYINDNEVKEMVLIVVVLIGIVVLFKKKLTTLVSDIFTTIKERAGEV